MNLHSYGVNSLIKASRAFSLESEVDKRVNASAKPMLAISGKQAARPG